jgi:hypothetical protein
LPIVPLNDPRTHWQIAARAAPLVFHEPGALYANLELSKEGGSGAQGGNSSVQLSAFNLQVEEINIRLFVCKLSRLPAVPRSALTLFHESLSVFELP